MIFGTARDPPLWAEVQSRVRGAQKREIWQLRSAVSCAVGASVLCSPDSISTRRQRSKAGPFAPHFTCLPFGELLVVPQSDRSPVSTIVPPVAKTVIRTCRFVRNAVSDVIILRTTQVGVVSTEKSLFFSVVSLLLPSASSLTGFLETNAKGARWPLVV